MNGLGVGGKGKRRIRVLPRLWVCAMRWAVMPFIEVGKAGAIGGNLKICFEHNEFIADQVSR